MWVDRMKMSSKTRETFYLVIFNAARVLTTKWDYNTLRAHATQMKHSPKYAQRERTNFGKTIDKHTARLNDKIVAF